MSATPKAPCEAVLIVGFGGPTSREEIRPFLDRVLKGRPVPRDRYEEVVRHYERFDGRSPYNEVTMRQAEALRARLRADGGNDVPVLVGFRNTPPFLDDAMAELVRRRVRRVLGFVLAAHRCEASWERYQRDVDEARAHVGASAPEVDYPISWHNHPLFIEAVTARVRDAISQLSPAERSRMEIIFTAHSIPLAMAERSHYTEELEESGRMVALAAGHARWTLAFQSRSGSPNELWLEPDVCDVLRTLKGRPAIVVPFGFLCDHVEVLYDLDIAAAEVAHEAGVRMIRAATVGDHPKFIDMMTAVARTPLGR